MNKKIFLLSILAVVASFVGGFLVANAFNRQDLSALRQEIENLKKARAETERNKQEMTLSDEEIGQRIAEADKSPNNIPFQKNLGLALYNYASMRQNADLLKEVSRLVSRVYADNPNDYTAIVTLGNINFDLGYFNKSDENLKKAREFYQKALRQKPDDADVITDLGLTYFLAEPPESDRAVAEFEKSLQINPKSEKTLQAIVQVLNSQEKTAEAEKYIVRLKEINPANEALTPVNMP